MSENRSDHRRFVISRTDSIGDAVLTLPVAGLLKRHFPGCSISFLGRSYTESVIACCAHIDRFLNWDEIGKLDEEAALKQMRELKADVFIHVFPVKEIARLVKKAGVPVRIGTSHRVYHLGTCNRLVNLGRKNSAWHEAQLNLMLLNPLGIKETVDTDAIPALYGFSGAGDLAAVAKAALDPGRFNLIIHPRSKGSAREWGLDNYAALLKLLPGELFNVILTGTKEEGAAVRGRLFADKTELVDMTGQLSLAEFIGLIGAADGLLAASTGPLHLASALGKHALGLYAPMRPIHPGRWAPLGERAQVFVLDKKCHDCKAGGSCACIAAIAPEEVAGYLLGLVSDIG